MIYSNEIICLSFLISFFVKFITSFSFKFISLSLSLSYLFSLFLQINLKSVTEFFSLSFLSNFTISFHRNILKPIKTNKRILDLLKRIGFPCKAMLQFFCFHHFPFPVERKEKKCSKKFPESEPESASLSPESFHLFNFIKKVFDVN